jgi:hypothetical protein
MSEPSESAQEALEDLASRAEVVDLDVQTTGRGTVQMKIMVRPPGNGTRTLTCERLPDGTLNWLSPKFWPLTDKDTWQPFKGDDSAEYLHIAWLVARYLADDELGGERQEVAATALLPQDGITSTPTDSSH